MQRELLIVSFAGLLIGCEGAPTVVAERSDYQTPRDPESEYQEPSFPGDEPGDLNPGYVRIVAASFSGEIGYVSFDEENAYVQGESTSTWSFFYVETYDPEWAMVQGDFQGALTGLPLEVKSGGLGIGCSGQDELPLDGVVVTGISDSPLVTGGTDVTMYTELPFNGELQRVDITLTLQ